MREWDRTTRSCGWDELPDAPLAQYAELHGRDDLSADPVACVETVSTSLKRSLFRGPKSHRTVVGLTRRYLIWSDGGGGEEVVSAARVDGLEVREYASGLIEDSGLEVTGFRLDAAERASWFLPLDGGPDAMGFRDSLVTVIAGAKHRP